MAITTVGLTASSINPGATHNATAAIAPAPCSTLIGIVSEYYTVLPATNYPVMGGCATWSRKKTTTFMQGMRLSLFVGTAPLSNGQVSIDFAIAPTYLQACILSCGDADRQYVDLTQTKSTTGLASMFQSGMVAWSSSQSGALIASVSTALTSPSSPELSQVIFEDDVLKLFVAQRSTAPSNPNLRVDNSSMAYFALIGIEIANASVAKTRFTVDHIGKTSFTVRDTP